MVGEVFMKKKALYTSIFREIRQSKARFFSILGIIFLGVCFYAGIKATGPNMLQTAETYYKEQKLMDQRVISPVGLTETDVKLAKKMPEVDQAVGVYSEDLNIEENNRVVKIQSQEFENQQINALSVVSGRLPKNDQEIVLDNRAKLLNDFTLEDEFDIPKEQQKNFEKKSYKIVGFVNSPMYIENISRGKTTVGKGSVDYLAFLKPKAFKKNVFSDITLTYKGTKALEAYGTKYDKELKKAETQLKSQFKSREKERFEEVTDDLSAELAKTVQSERALKKAATNIKEQKILLEQVNDQVSLKELTKKEKELANQEYQLTGAKKEIKKQQEALSKTSKDYLFTDRESNPGYSEYRENAKRLSSIATVFPVFFFLIAALVCLTTMTRMVDEKRGEIGALKALGYTNRDIALKYIFYAAFASIIGSVLGLVVGYHLFPTVIIDAYGSLYNLPAGEVTYYTSYTVQSIIVALICTLLSALLVLRYDLFNTPATLLRPKAPKVGKRILLERVSFIWRRLNFNQKVTARNLFRYKQRMFMTVIGIAGCMALMITGFGIRDSISDVVTLQFDKLWHYQAIVTHDEDLTKEEQQKYEHALADLTVQPEALRIAQESYDVVKKGQPSISVTVDIPKQTDHLADFILFNDRKSGERYQLTDDGVIVSEKIAKLFSLREGDNLPLTNNEGQVVQVKIKAIVENYAMHFVYMTPAYYQKVFGEKPKYQSDLLLFNDTLNQQEENKISEKLLTLPHVVNVTFLSETSSAMSDTIDSLNVVVWVLIISAALLAFIVLYNLTNINISERIRELSTIKVLGFYNKEVTMYIYRENNILTALGILLGGVVGKLLHRFVLSTAEVDMMMFSPTIHLGSYVYAAILTIFFSLVVMYVMHRKLVKVDMIEALKSNE